MYLKDVEFWVHECPPSSSWYWKKLCAVRDGFASGYGGHSWLADKSGQYTIASGYRWLLGEQRKMDVGHACYLAHDECASKFLYALVSCLETIGDNGSVACLDFSCSGRCNLYPL